MPARVVGGPAEPREARPPRADLPSSASRARPARSAARPDALRRPGGHQPHHRPVHHRARAPRVAVRHRRRRRRRRRRESRRESRRGDGDDGGGGDDRWRPRWRRLERAAARLDEHALRADLPAGPRGERAREGGRVVSWRHASHRRRRVVGVARRAERRRRSRRRRRRRQWRRRVDAAGDPVACRPRPAARDSADGDRAPQGGGRRPLPLLAEHQVAPLHAPLRAAAGGARLHRHVSRLRRATQGRRRQRAHAHAGGGARPEPGPGERPLRSQVTRHMVHVTCDNTCHMRTLVEALDPNIIMSQCKSQNSQVTQVTIILNDVGQNSRNIHSHCSRRIHNPCCNCCRN